MPRRLLVPFLCLTLISGGLCAIEADQVERGQQAVARLNLYRAMAGLPSVSLDDSLSLGCIAHANYLNLNKDQILGGLTAHDEFPDRPGFTQEGKEAGTNSDIFYGGTGSAAIDGWFETYYHRNPLMSPGVKKVGYGDNPGAAVGFEIAVLQFSTYTGPGDVLSPANNSQGNAVWGFGEVPEPVPNFGKGTGNPIIAYFAGDKVAWVGSKVIGGGAELPHFVVAPNKPSQPVYEINEICLVTHAPMPKGAAINVEIKYMQSGTEKTLIWTFFTSADGKFDAAAATGGMTTGTGMPETDTDGDGFFDAIEIAAGTDPLGVGSTPFGGAPAGTVQPFTLTSLKAGLNFTKENSDAISLAGTLPLAGGAALEQQQIVIDVGGVARAFIIDVTGKGSPALNDKFKIATKPKDGVVKFGAKFSKGSYRTALADENMTAITSVKSQPRMIKVSIVFKGVLYENPRQVVYSSTASKKGSAK